MIKRLQENIQSGIRRGFGSPRRRSRSTKPPRKRRSRSVKPRSRKMRSRSKRSRSRKGRSRSRSKRKTRRDWWNAKTLAGTGLAQLHENRESSQD